MAGARYSPCLAPGSSGTQDGDVPPEQPPRDPRTRFVRDQVAFLALAAAAIGLVGIAGPVCALFERSFAEIGRELPRVTRIALAAPARALVVALAIGLFAFSARWALRPRDGAPSPLDDRRVAPAVIVGLALVVGFYLFAFVAPLTRPF